LSEENKCMLWIPEGFGHGFSTLTDGVEITYKCTDVYDPNLDGGIRFDDPELNIDWKIKEPILSEKDKKLPYFSEARLPT
jgi:dTDP-4-dehydrorhamnose 3,5-epimerase